MKTIYIPKGETVHYESLSTDHLIVEDRKSTRPNSSH